MEGEGEEEQAPRKSSEACSAGGRADAASSSAAKYPLPDLASNSLFVGASHRASRAREGEKKRESGSGTEEGEGGGAGSKKRRRARAPAPARNAARWDAKCFNAFVFCLL